MVPKLVVVFLAVSSMVYLGTLATSIQQAFVFGAIANLHPNLVFVVVREEAMSWGDFARYSLLGGAVYATAFVGMQHLFE